VWGVVVQRELMTALESKRFLWNPLRINIVCDPRNATAADLFPAHQVSPTLNHRSSLKCPAIIETSMHGSMRSVYQPHQAPV
jgi:hypothetical protein